jgi:hypothetical protein
MNKFKTALFAITLSVSGTSYANYAEDRKMDTDISGCLVAAAFAKNESAIQKLMSMAKNKGDVAKRAQQMGKYIAEEMTPQQREKGLNGLAGVCSKIGITL